MTKPKLFTALLLLLLAGGLFAERDSLCMRLEDTLVVDSDWGGSIRFGTHVQHDGYLYFPMMKHLGVFHVDTLGQLQCDTTVLSSDVSGNIRDLFVNDTILFSLNFSTIVILDISEPARPESLAAIKYFHPAFGTPTRYNAIGANDSILWGIGRAHYRYIDIYDITDISAIDSFELIVTEGLLEGEVDFPYIYDVDFSLDTMLWMFPVSREISITDFTQVGTISRNTFSIPLEGWFACVNDYNMQDSILAVSYASGRPSLEIFQVTASRDSVWYLSSWYDNVPGYTENYDVYIERSDSLIFLTKDNQLFVVSMSDPMNLRTKAYYCDTGVALFLRPAVLDSFLIVPTFLEGGSRLEMWLFKVPCTDCEGNCELQILPEELQFHTYPNPFNSRCEIKYSFPTTRGGKLTIHDITGRMLIEQRLKDKTGVYRWDAKGQGSGIYLITCQDDCTAVSKKVVFLS